MEISTVVVQNHSLVEYVKLQVDRRTDIYVSRTHIFREGLL